MMNLSDAAKSQARKAPEREALTSLEEGVAHTWTFAVLDRRIDAVAGALHGFTPGARALILLPPGLDFVAAFPGALRAGLLAPPSPPSL